MESGNFTFVYMAEGQIQQISWLEPWTSDRTPGFLFLTKSLPKEAESLEEARKIPARGFN